MAAAQLTGAELQERVAGFTGIVLPQTRTDAIVAAEDWATRNSNNLSTIDATYDFYQWDEISSVNGTPASDVKAQYPNDGPYVLQERKSDGFVEQIHLLPLGEDINQWITDYKNDLAQTMSNDQVTEKTVMDVLYKLGDFLDQNWDTLNGAP